MKALLQWGMRHRCVTAEHAFLFIYMRSLYCSQITRSGVFPCWLISLGVNILKVSSLRFCPAFCWALRGGVFRLHTWTLRGWMCWIMDQLSSAPTVIVGGAFCKAACLKRWNEIARLKGRVLNSVNSSRRTEAKFSLAGHCVSPQLKICSPGTWSRLSWDTPMTVKGDGYSAHLNLTAWAVEQMGLHAAPPGVPLFSCVVPAFRASGAGAEHLDALPFLFSVESPDRVWRFAELFSAPPTLFGDSFASVH